jgi:hypothetical protein
MFILIAEKIVLKEKIFQKARIYCNIQYSESERLGNVFGNMTSAQLETAIASIRNNDCDQYSGKPEARFLQSIRAACEELPHSNEASMNARKTYFSFLIKFGPPAIFFTITPDDQRNFRIVLYSLKKSEKIFSLDNVENLTDEEVILDMNIRREARVSFPGLCAEEYMRIVDLVIRIIFNWDSENKCSMGPGLFSEILAWCLATEEQGRKSLHGHFLLFVKEWQSVMDCLQKRSSNTHRHVGMSIQDATRTAIQFHDYVSCSRTFQDFEPGKPLSKYPPFWHDD